MADKRIRVTLVKSTIGCKRAHRETVKGLGLRRQHQTVELPDTPEVRGMILRVGYLVRCKPSQ